MDYRFDAIILAVSGHYRLMRQIVSSPDYPRQLTPEEASDADYLSGVIGSLLGKRIEDYCIERFQRGWMTGDLRSYKIKFVLLKIRDILKDEALRNDYTEHLEELTERAERLAGCISDGKRRNRQALEERAQTRKEKDERKAREDAERPVQMDFLDSMEDRSETDDQEESISCDLSDYTLDDTALLYRPRGLRKRKSSKREIAVSKPIETVKKKPKKTRLEKLTEEILQTEYRSEEEETEEDFIEEITGGNYSRDNFCTSEEAEEADEINEINEDE